ncbi:MAG TPA: DUF4386 family protein [Candidatus Saccharimonadales bacterium]|nr:DUF4386 family protein [Candidatus Saccharimonadales bacterium]
MSIRKTSVAVGVLFIVQMVTAMFGTMQIQEFVDGGPGKAAPTLGVLLMMCSATAVIGIGLLAYRVLKLINQRLAIWYPIMRVIEGVVSTACGIYLLIQLQAVPNHMLLVYVPTVIGGLVFTYLLYVSRVVPRFVAVLGLIGYGLLGLGTLLNFLSVVDLNAEGIALLVPGLLFELLVLPFWLIVKGFKAPRTVAAR